MKIRPLAIEGAWEISPVQHGDERGLFLELQRHDWLAEATGRPFPVAQVNLSVSVSGVVRGIHFADTPPGQAKYVTCVAGAVLDVIVDLRVGSPTFGTWELVRLDDADRRSVFLSEGLGHGFCALSEAATMVYQCSQPYNPVAERAVHPYDPELAIEWPADTPLMSPRDSAAPTLAEALEQGLLPSYQACVGYVSMLRRDNE